MIGREIGAVFSTIGITSSVASLLSKPFFALIYRWYTEYTGAFAIETRLCFFSQGNCRVSTRLLFAGCRWRTHACLHSNHSGAQVWDQQKKMKAFLKVSKWVLGEIMRVFTMWVWLPDDFALMAQLQGTEGCGKERRDGWKASAGIGRARSASNVWLKECVLNQFHNSGWEWRLRGGERPDVNEAQRR